VTKAQLKQAEGSFSDLQRKIADTPKPTRLMINELNKAEKALNQLKTKQGKMITRHAQMGDAMRQSGINTGNLSETQRRLKTDLAATNTQLEQQRTKMGQLADQQKRMNQVKANYRQTQELRGQLAGHGAGAIASGTAMGLPVL
jgi:phage-related tail protein